MKIKLLQQILRLHFYGSHLAFFGQTATRNVSLKDQTAHVSDWHKPQSSLELTPRMAPAPARQGPSCRQDSPGRLASLRWHVPSPGRSKHWSSAAGAHREEENSAFLLLVPAHRYSSAFITTCLLSIHVPLTFLDAIANTLNTNTPNNPFLLQVWSYRTDGTFKTARKSSSSQYALATKEGEWGNVEHKASSQFWYF